jgi:hypothetical protein
MVASDIGRIRSESSSASSSSRVPCARTAWSSAARPWEKAVQAGDEGTFASSLTALLDAVRQQGTRLEDDSLEDSDLILPPSDATLEEVRALLTDEGLVPD